MNQSCQNSRQDTGMHKCLAYSIESNIIQNNNCKIITTRSRINKLVTIYNEKRDGVLNLELGDVNTNATNKRNWQPIISNSSRLLIYSQHLNLDYFNNVDNLSLSTQQNTITKDKPSDNSIRLNITLRIPVILLGKKKISKAKVETKQDSLQNIRIQSDDKESRKPYII